MFPQFSVFASAAAVVRLMSLTHCTLLLPSWMIHFFCCCRLVRRTLVSHLPHFSLSTTPWRQTAITGCFIPGWLDLLAAFCHLHRSGLEASRLSKCVEAVRSLTMSIFLFVTSVTKDKKKSLFPQCDGCLAFHPLFKRLEWGTFLLLEREFDFNMYLFLPLKLRMPPLPRQGCSLPGTILKSSGVKRKKKR